MSNFSTYKTVEIAPTVVGTPGVEGTSPLVQQSYPDNCAIRCQELVLRDFGINVSEDDLINQASNQGWYSPGGGTSPEDVGNLLELHGVQVKRYDNANVFTLTSELAKGNRVIIGVDSGELWNQGFDEDIEDISGMSAADHALIVSGIDTTDPNNVKVVLTDPGSGDVAKEYPIDQFIDAWQDSNCFMVSTVEPAPIAFNPEMVNFDYASGHLSEIGNLAYDDFQQLFSSCWELELSDSVINYQAELLTKYVNEGDLVAEDYDIENDLIAEHSDFSPTTEDTWNDLSEVSLLEDDDYSEDNSDEWENEDDFSEDVFE